jgi:hypothetical protein
MLYFTIRRGEQTMDQCYELVLGVRTNNFMQQVPYKKHDFNGLPLSNENTEPQRHTMK